MSEDLAHIVLRGFPLQTYLQSQVHFEELMREFQLVAIGHSAGVHGERPVPDRLLELVGQLTKRHRGRAEVIDAERSAAIARNETHIDLRYDIPLAAKEPLRQLAALTEECDAFCRSDQYLLTLETPPEVVAFRRWYVGQILDQMDGAAPTPWTG